MSEDDITSLPVHHCYVRATVGKERMPAFSMMVRRPDPGNPYTAELIRANTSAYTLPARDIAEGNAEAQKLVDRFHEGLAALAAYENPSETEEAEDAKEPDATSEETKRRKPRTKHRKPGQENGQGDNLADEEGDPGEERDQ